MDESVREHKIQRGLQAQEVIDNPAFQEAVNQIANEMFANFLASESADEERREKLWATGQALGNIKSKLQFFAQEGRSEATNRKIDREEN